MKLDRAHSSQSQFQARLESLKNAHRRNLEEVPHLASPPPSGNSLFKSEVPSYRSVDEVVTAGNQEFENLDNVDFANFRNDKEMAKETLHDAEIALTPFYSDRSTKEYKEELNRVMDARYLQGHGVQVAAHLDGQEMHDLRGYIQKETSTNNVADEVRAINTSLASGTESVDQLTHAAEKSLFSERGVPADVFETKYGNRSLDDLEKVRDFADAWSTSQSGRVLLDAGGDNFEQNRDSMARALLKEHGYKGLENLDLDTVLSLLRDIDVEGPRTNATIRDTVNRELASGQTDYFLLNTAANEAVLHDMGVDESFLQGLKVSDHKLKEKYPKLPPRESRAIRTRVLRDVLRVLPAAEREQAKSALTEAGADLISAESVLKKHLGHRIKEFTHSNASYQKMGAMQRANFASALSKLPEDVREAAFAGTEEQAKDTLTDTIQSRFGIEVHRKAGQAPDGSEQNAPYVKDWTVQGLVDLYNAMNGMAAKGTLPKTLIGNSTICYVEGAAPSLPMQESRTPVNSDPVGAWDRPGAFAHKSGKSGYFGMCLADDKGHDFVYFCDDALMAINADSADALTIGESTITHEFGHAIQLGGTPGADSETRRREQQLNMAEWSSLSDWREPGRILADGRMGSFEYYYDPTVQVGHRLEVATSYGASDPCEDFAEFSPFFFRAPDTAMELSPEKFLYFNHMADDFYSPEKVKQVGALVGLDAAALERAEQSMKAKVAGSAGEAGLQG